MPFVNFKKLITLTALLLFFRIGTGKAQIFDSLSSEMPPLTLYDFYKNRASKKALTISGKIKAGAVFLLPDSLSKIYEFFLPLKDSSAFYFPFLPLRPKSSENPEIIPDYRRDIYEELKRKN